MFKLGRNNKYFGIRADITRMSFCNHENLQTLSFRKNYLTVKMELKRVNYQSWNNRRSCSLFFHYNRSANVINRRTFAFSRVCRSASCILHFREAWIVSTLDNPKFFSNFREETDGKRIRTLIADLFPPESYFFSVFGDFNKSRTFIGVEKIISQFLHTCIFFLF